MNTTGREFSVTLTRENWVTLDRQTMRIVAFITEPQVIDRILDHFRRTAVARRRSRAPPARARMVRAAAGSGSA